MAVAELSPSEEAVPAPLPSVLRLVQQIVSPFRCHLPSRELSLWSNYLGYWKQEMNSRAIELGEKRREQVTY